MNVTDGVHESSGRENPREGRTDGYARRDVEIEGQGLSEKRSIETRRARDRRDDELKRARLGKGGE